jgi:hypothetical protein
MHMPAANWFAHVRSLLLCSVATQLRIRLGFFTAQRDYSSLNPVVLFTPYSVTLGVIGLVFLLV